MKSSPLFQYRNASLAAGAVENTDMRNHSTVGKHLPIDTIHISNNSSETIIVTFNGGTNSRRIFAKTSRSYSGQSITSFSVENAGTGTIAANDIEIEYQNEGTTPDNILQGFLSKIGL